jgi:2-C-methyl-D-erythritol 2,4-cyclodiphosphate synthase
MSDLRIGHGFDVHAFTEGDHLMLGGVKIPFDKAFAAHSDGDVLLHAVCDALLGAAGLGDIGRHFPDTDAAFENIDSALLLQRVMQKLGAEGYRVVNADVTVVAQAPKLSPHIAAMTANLAAMLQAPANVKATTTERLGYTGRGEGIAVHSVVLIEHDSEMSPIP